MKLAAHVSRIVATDLSGEMIAIAREKAAAEACVNAEFAVATPENTSWPDNSFDAVLAFNLWHLVADRTSALAHVHRVLKPGGLFVSKTPCLAEMNPLIRLAVPVMQFVGKAPYVALFSASALEREIEAAGFAIIERARHGSRTQGCTHLHRRAEGRSRGRARPASGPHGRSLIFSPRMVTPAGSGSSWCQIAAIYVVRNPDKLRHLH